MSDAENTGGGGSIASGLVIIIIAAWVLIRTVRGNPRLADVVLYGRQGAQQLAANIPTSSTSTSSTAAPAPLKVSAAAVTRQTVAAG